jgi:hypothetical protein
MKKARSNGNSGQTCTAPIAISAAVAIKNSGAVQFSSMPATVEVTIDQRSQRLIAVRYFACRRR